MYFNFQKHMLLDCIGLPMDLSCWNCWCFGPLFWVVDICFSVWGEVGNPRFYCWWPHGCWMCFMILELVSHLKIWIFLGWIAIKCLGPRLLSLFRWEILGIGGGSFPYFGTDGSWMPLHCGVFLWNYHSQSQSTSLTKSHRVQNPICKYEQSKMVVPTSRTLLKRGPHPFQSKPKGVWQIKSWVAHLAQKPNSVNS